MSKQVKETTIPEEESTREEYEEQPEETSEPIDTEPVEEEMKDEETEVTQLIDKVEKITNENKQLTERLLRLQAEFENYRKRTEKEKIAERKYRSQDFATELLPVLDNFERALKTEVSEENKGFLEGMQMIYDQLQTAFESQGITKIDAKNQEFNPNLHHAVMQVEDEEIASNIVVEELQTGYMLKDKVIRPAMVKVNK